MEVERLAKQVEREGGPRYDRDNPKGGPEFGLQLAECQEEAYEQRSELQREGRARRAHTVPFGTEREIFLRRRIRPVCHPDEGRAIADGSGRITDRPSISEIQRLSYRTCGFG